MASHLMRRQTTYALILSVILSSGCSLFYKETLVYDVFDPESKPIRVQEPRWRMCSPETEDARRRRVARAHDTLKSKWGSQLTGEWRLAEADKESKQIKYDCTLSFADDDTAHIRVKDGGELSSKDGRYLFKNESTDGSVLIIIDWNLSEEEKKDIRVATFLPLVLWKGTNIFLQIANCPKLIKTDK